MKKTNYVATLYYKSGGEIIETPPLSDAVAERIVAQANAGQTIHMFDGSVEYIIPWESVVEVQYRRIMEDVEAPTDAICSDGSNGLVIPLNDDIAFSKSGTSPDCYTLVSPFMDINVEGITLNGEPVDPEDFYENFDVTTVPETTPSQNPFYPGDGTIPMDCGLNEGDTFCYDATFTYQGVSTTCHICGEIAGGE